MSKTSRNDPCPCGSGKKYKKCCVDRQASHGPFTWADDDGIHVVDQGAAPSAEELEKMTKIYQKKIRNSPLWDDMVKKFGKEEAERLLKECKAEMR